MNDRDFVLNSVQTNQQLLHALVDDLEEEQMATQPIAGVVLNHPAWVLGHLAVSNDMAAGLLGGGGVCPADWVARFDMGTRPAGGMAGHPSKATLIAMVDASLANVVELLRRADEAALAKPTSGPLAQWFATVGDAVVTELTGHMGIHMGQVSAWRRAMGRPPLF